MKTFVGALRGKYNDDDENEENFVNMVLITRPRRISTSAEFEYLTNVVLGNMKISTVDISPLSALSLCPNVVDLDLSQNLLTHWCDVMGVISSLPKVKYLNLAGNRFRPFNNLISWPEGCPASPLENLVLNYTGATWRDAVAIGNILPNLRELHLCQNEYWKVTAPRKDISRSLSNLRCLRLNGNYFKRWEEIGKLKDLPFLETLILSNNPLTNVTTSIPLSPRKAPTPRKLVDSPRSKKLSGSPNPKRTRTRSGGDEKSHAIRKLFSEESEETSNSPPVVPSGSEGDVIERLMEEMLFVVDHNSERMHKCYLDHALQKPRTLKRENRCRAATPDGYPSREPQDMDYSEEDPGFPSLKVLCVSNTRLSDWSDLEALNKFPSLRGLKLQNVSFLEDYTIDDRRKLLISLLPNIEILNGSEVTPCERDKAEQFFIRHFIRQPVKPERYSTLVQIYGELTPLDEVDLGRGFQEYASLSFVYEGRAIHQTEVQLTQPVGKLKIFCAELLMVPTRKIKMHHMTRDGGARQELFLESLPMSRYDMTDGDQIHIDVTV